MHHQPTNQPASQPSIQQTINNNKSPTKEVAAARQTAQNSVPPKAQSVFEMVFRFFVGSSNSQCPQCQYQYITHHIPNTNKCHWRSPSSVQPLINQLINLHSNRRLYWITYKLYPFLNWSYHNSCIIFGTVLPINCFWTARHSYTAFTVRFTAPH